MPHESIGDRCFVVWDVETLRLSQEVRGGWRNIKDFGLSVAVTIDDCGVEHSWEEPDAASLITYLESFRYIVGFNSLRFDAEVLSAYGPVGTLRERSLDLLASIQEVTGRRRGLSLENIARTMFGEGKSLSDGTESVRLWRTGRAGDRQRVIDYCKQDVALTRRIFEFGLIHGYVLAPVPNISQGDAAVTAQVPVNWRELEGLPTEPLLVEPEPDTF